jgi:hypothetical protein
MMMIKTLLAAALLCTALLQGCGSGSDNLSAPATPTPDPPAPYVPGTGYLEIDQTAITLMNQLQANSVTLSLVADGGTTVLSITTPATAANPVGQFVGGGTGNKGIVQLDGFDGLKLSDLAGVELDAKMVTGGTSNFYMNFLVDLDCVKNESSFGFPALARYSPMVTPATPSRPPTARG